MNGYKNTQWYIIFITMAKIVEFYDLIIFDVQKLICTKNIMTNKFQICIHVVFRLPLILWFFLLYVFTPTFRKTKKRNLLCDVNGVIWLRVSVIFGFQEIWSELKLIILLNRENGRHRLWRDYVSNWWPACYAYKPVPEII